MIRGVRQQDTIEYSKRTWTKSEVYRPSMIFSYPTGQLDVRNRKFKMAIPEQNHES